MQILATLISTFACCSLALGSQNILVIVADDFGVDQMGAYGIGADLDPDPDDGIPESITPTLDSLAQDGILFRNAWANPLCSSSRAALQTGRASFRLGIGGALTRSARWALDLAEITLPEMLDLGNSGYQHALLGKWHIGNLALGWNDHPNLQGYSHFAGTMANIQSEAGASYSNWLKVDNGVEQWVTTYPATDKVDDTIAWIQSAADPWFCMLSFNLPHAPYHCPPAHLHSVPLPLCPNDGSNSSNNRLYIKAMIQAMDSEIGRLLQALQYGTPGGDLENTLVLFLGDNGTDGWFIQPPQDYGHGKTTVYDGGVNVPFLAVGPGITQTGAECTGLVHVTDVFATVAEVAGVDLPTIMPGVQLDSISLLPYLADPSLPSRRQHLLAELFTELGPGSGDALTPPPGGCFCQPDLGFQGPGLVALSICGSPFAEGNGISLHLTHAPPASLALVTISTLFNPTPAFGGTLVTVPLIATRLLPTDSLGEIHVQGVTLTNDVYDLQLYLQAVVADPGQPQGVQISNAVGAKLLPRHVKAIRDENGYKLITKINHGPWQDEFYNLNLDPIEQTNLLIAGMTSAEEQIYLDLRTQLFLMLDPSSAGDPWNPGPPPPDCP